MKQLQIVGPNQPEWQDVDMPQPGTGEVLLKVDAVTTCPHWDLHMMSGEPMFPGARVEYPLTPGQPGHEIVGSVVEVGPGVHDFGVGARVAAWRDRGAKVRLGGYAQYVPFAADCLLEVSTDLAPQSIASLELAMCVQVTFDRLQNFDLLQGKRIAVGGMGPAGLLAVQMARAWGAETVIAVDPVADRRERALALGVDAAVEPKDGAFADAAGGPVDVAVDCAGAKSSVEFLMGHTRGAVALFGVLRDDVAYGWQQWRSGVDILGYGSHNRDAAERALALIEDGRLDLSCVVTHELPLRDYAAGVELLRTQQALKVCFLPHA
ncbi:MAG: zinc-binding dehydrogenase [bacterium]|nr:zinc-binding dehydrogenase [bacterium]